MGDLDVGPRVGDEADLSGVRVQLPQGTMRKPVQMPGRKSLTTALFETSKFATRATLLGHNGAATYWPVASSALARSAPLAAGMMAAPGSVAPLDGRRVPDEVVVVQASSCRATETSSSVVTERRA